MYSEKNCIFYNDGKCKKEEERNNYISCTTCKDKCILEEGQKIEITEHYTLQRKNGKLKKL